MGKELDCNYDPIRRLIASPQDAPEIHEALWETGSAASLGFGLGVAQGLLTTLAQHARRLEMELRRRG